MRKIHRERLIAARSIISIGEDAAQKNLLEGFSGNISVRLASGLILITRARVPKRRLSYRNLVLCTPEGKIIAGAGKASSESGLHFAIYEKFSGCRAILHTHPPHMQALELKIPDFDREFPQTDLYEAQIWRTRLAWMAATPPGGAAVASLALRAMCSAFSDNPPWPCGLWLSRHGFCAMGENLLDCLALSEEFEHLAKVQLLAM